MDLYYKKNQPAIVQYALKTRDMQETSTIVYFFYISTSIGAFIKVPDWHNLKTSSITDCSTEKSCMQIQTRTNPTNGKVKKKNHTSIFLNKISLMHKKLTHSGSRVTPFCKFNIFFWWTSFAGFWAFNEQSFLIFLYLQYLSLSKKTAPRSVNQMSFVLS